MNRLRRRLRQRQRQRQLERPQRDDVTAAEQRILTLILHGDDLWCCGRAAKTAKTRVLWALLVGGYIHRDYSTPSTYALGPKP